MRVLEGQTKKGACCEHSKIFFWACLSLFCINSPQRVNVEATRRTGGVKRGEGG